ncbi:MAG: pyridoxal-phosphate dependent enzyme [Deltaproteobacteria bacterium]|nr:pyridoxal-phosphate dependent enzyme [Deltaproteobacteria bacterium]
MKGGLDNILGAVGRTALVRLQRVVPGDFQGELYGKCEFLNPSGSSGDRIAEALVDDAERQGALKPGGTLVEATSGNTGAALALVAAVRGYGAVFVVPDKASPEKVAALRAFGHRVVVCPSAVEPSDPRSHHAVARKIAEDTPGAVLLRQHHNPANPEAHYRTTGPELWDQTGGELDVLVGGLGTGGTLSGAGRYLKERKPSIKVVGVDPVGSLVHDFVKHGLLTRAFPYKVEGIGEDFFPSTLDAKVLDDVVRVDDRECFLMTRELVRREGLFCGGSAGAAVAGALKWARGRKEKCVVLLPDGAGRYLSKVFNDDWMRENGFLAEDKTLGTVRELLAGRAQNLVTARSDDTLRHVIGTMKAHGISQVPVLDGDQLRGILSEVTVLRNLVSGEAHLDSTIAPIVETDYATVTPDTRIDLLQNVLADAKAALVIDGPALLGIIAKIDVIDYLARRVTA